MENLTQLALRRAIPPDAPAIRNLVRAAYAKWVPVFGREPLPMTADYDLAVREHLVDLAHKDGQLAAVIELIQRPDDLFIENLAVHPDYQGLGLGRLLIAHAEVVARDSGVARLCLLTGQLMASNVLLYQSVGFQIDRTEPFMGGFTVYMSKVLAQN